MAKKKRGVLFANQNEVAIWQRMFEEWITESVGGEWRVKINLRDFSRVCRQSGDKNQGRVFMALFDLFVAFEMMFADYWDMCNLYNALASKPRRIGPAHHDEEAFRLKCEMHRRMSAFVLRCRAYHDKFLGFSVIIDDPEYYENVFIKCDSRKDAFVAYAHQLEARFVAEDSEYRVDFDRVSKQITEVQKLDDEFRTAEAHYTGVLSRHSFLIVDPKDDVTHRLDKFWQYANGSMGEIRRIIQRRIDELSSEDSAPEPQDVASPRIPHKPTERHREPCDRKGDGHSTIVRASDASERDDQQIDSEDDR